MRPKRSKPGIEIRSAAPSKAEAVASVLYQSFAEFRAFYTDEAFRATTPASDGIRLRMDEGPVWIALDGGAIFGTVSAVPRGEALYVRGMAVLPSARGKGIGRLLLGHVEAFARAGRYKSLILSTTPFLTDAIRLYEQAGFRRSQEGPQELFGTPLFTMVKTFTL